YSLYLYQAMTLFTAKRLTAGLPVAVQFAFAVAVTVLFATASYFLVERPFLALKHRRPSPFPRRPLDAGEDTAEVVQGESGDRAADEDAAEPVDVRDVEVDVL